MGPCFLLQLKGTLNYCVEGTYIWDTKIGDMTYLMSMLAVVASFHGHCASIYLAFGTVSMKGMDTI